MNVQNLGLAQQLQTSKFELRCSQTEVSNLRISVERNQSTETRDAEYLQHLWRDNLSLARGNLWQSAEIDRRILNLGAAEVETVRIQSQLEDAQNTINSWSRAEGPTGVGSGDATLLMATHTPLETPLSPVYKTSPSQAQFLLQRKTIAITTSRRRGV